LKEKLKLTSIVASVNAESDWAIRFNERFSLTFLWKRLSFPTKL